MAAKTCETTTPAATVTTKAGPEAEASTKPTNLPLTYKKRLVGIRATPELLSLIKEAAALVAAASTATTTTKNESLNHHSTSKVMSPIEAQTALLKYDSEVLSLPQSNQVTTSTPSCNETETTKTETNNKPRSKTQKQETKEDTTSPKGPTFIPIQVLRAAGNVLGKDSKPASLLEEAIRSSSLAFTEPPFNNDAAADSAHQERFKFQKRMERLRLKQEETNYSKLTRNVMDSKALMQDDVTTRSMTYAASIGLNMIVAPLSFGCFMYFFSGSILGWVSESSMKHGTVDIRRVIVSVISGVIMLFIEMLLFVIRTHEVDRAMRGKQRKREQKSKAFGYYTANTERTYKKDE